MIHESTFNVFVSPQKAQSSAFHEKLQAYSEVCRNFRPVFRYFCMERFLDPAVWMEQRLAYTRSVATSSIGTGCPAGAVRSRLICELFLSLICFVFTVGYIVGLGDRHIQNILIDEQTAELVHIDLGKMLLFSGGRGCVNRHCGL